MPFSTDLFLQNVLRDLNIALDDEEVSLEVIIYYYEQFCTLFQVDENFQPEQIKVFSQCSVKYVDLIKICILNDSTLDQTQMEKFKRIIGVVGAISKLECIRDAYYISFLTVSLFERIAEPDITQWFAKELLKICNVALEGTNRMLRNAIVEKLQYNLCKLGDIICTCGDFEYQTMLMETIFRLCSKAQINKYARVLFSKSAEFEKGLISINRNNFKVDCRTFLNMVNSKLKKVKSVKCVQIWFGEIHLALPKDLDDSWLDFNRGANTITIFCNKDCLRTSPTTQNHQNDDDFEVITINIADIGSVIKSSFIASKSPYTLGTILGFFKTKPCSVIYRSSLELSKGTDLIIMLKYTELDMLEMEALPDWFRENFKKHWSYDYRGNTDATQEELGRTLTIAVYKPLRAEIPPNAKSGASTVSSTSDATSLKGKIQKHQDKAFIQTKTERISKSPKIRNLKRLKQKAADPKFARIAKEQEQNQSCVAKESFIQPKINFRLACDDIQNKNENQSLVKVPFASIASPSTKRSRISYRRTRKEIIKVKWPLWQKKVGVATVTNIKHKDDINDSVVPQKVVIDSEVENLSKQKSPIINTTSNKTDCIEQVNSENQTAEMIADTERINVEELTTLNEQVSKSVFFEGSPSSKLNEEQEKRDSYLTKKVDEEKKACNSKKRTREDYGNKVSDSKRQKRKIEKLKLKVDKKDAVDLAQIKNEIKKLSCEVSQLKVIVANVLEKLDNLKRN